MRRTAALAFCSLLFLTACGGGDEDGGTGTPTATATATGGATPTESGTASPTAECEDADVMDVAGEVGEKPELTFDGDAPESLRRQIVTEGGGDTVQSGEILLAHYLGQVWDGDVFDNSYDRGAPAAFPIGVGRVIDGWDACLVGLTHGTRVVLGIPSEFGYPDGNEGAGIEAGDTLVFVVDIVDSFPNGGEAGATVEEEPPAGVTVEGALGEQPTIEVGDDAEPADEQTVTVLARGSGDEVREGMILVHYVVAGYGDEPPASSWQQGSPANFPVAEGGETLFDALVGIPVGSRVLAQLPAEGEESPAAVAVIDIVAQLPDAEPAVTQQPDAE